MQIAAPPILTDSMHLSEAAATDSCLQPPLMNNEWVETRQAARIHLHHSFLHHRKSLQRHLRGVCLRPLSYHFLSERSTHTSRGIVEQEAKGD